MENRGKELAQRDELGAHESQSPSQKSTEQEAASMIPSNTPMAAEDLEPGTVLTDEELENVFGGLSLDWEIDW